MKIEIEIPIKITELVSTILEEQNGVNVKEEEIEKHILFFLEKYINRALFQNIVEHEHDRLNHEYFQKKQDLSERTKQQKKDFRQYVDSLEQKYK